MSTFLKNYFQGTFINPDLNSVLLDPKLWETPEKFNPSHFLDKDGQFVDKKEYQLFAAGKYKSALLSYRWCGFYFK